MAQRLGDILLARGAVDAEKLSAALSDQKAFGGKLGRTLVELGYVDEQQLISALAEQLGLTTVDLDTVEVEDQALGTLSVNACERYGVFPVRLDPAQRVLWLATAEPDHATLQEIAQITQLTLEPVLAPMSQIERAVRRHYFGERPGDVKKQPKGEPLLSIPDEKAPQPQKPPPGKLPSSATSMADPDAKGGAAPAQGDATLEGEPTSQPIEGEPTSQPIDGEPTSQPIEGEPTSQPIDGDPTSQPFPRARTAEAAAAPPQPDPQRSPAPKTPTPAKGVARVDPAPVATPPPAGSAEDSPFASFGQGDAPADRLHSIAPSSGQLDDIQELQRIVLRLEKLVSAQGRAFRALVEIMQEKGLVRRGELGSRTSKKG